MLTYLTRFTIIILILNLSVRAGSHGKGILPELKTSFSSSLDLDVTCSSSLTQLAVALATTKVSRFERAAGQN